MRLAEMGGAPDYVAVAAEILGIRNAPPPLAQRLVAQALVIEDRQDEWMRVGRKACDAAPAGPAVYFFRDAAGAMLYVGKAVNLRRRLLSHFYRNRWPRLKPLMARVASVEWQEVGSDLEALLLEADRIQQLAPLANVQRARKNAAPARAQNVAVLLPSSDPARVTIVAARRDGASSIQSTARDGSGLEEAADALAAFFAGAASPALSASGLGSIVFAWLKQKGELATRFNASDIDDASEWTRALSRALASKDLFHERLIFR